MLPCSVQLRLALDCFSLHASHARSRLTQGHAGANWQSAWGPLNPDVLEACCACGGGTKLATKASKAGKGSGKGTKGSGKGSKGSGKGTKGSGKGSKGSSGKGSGKGSGKRSGKGSGKGGSGSGSGSGKGGRRGSSGAISN